MSEQTESVGRIEVAPEVLVTIAHYAALRVDGIAKMASAPTDSNRLFRRTAREDGIILQFTEEDRLKFDIYVIMDPNVNIMETSRALQTAVIEAIDTMVGIPVEMVNVHVEDVLYNQEEAL